MPPQFMPAAYNPESLPLFYKVISKSTLVTAVATFLGS